MSAALTLRRWVRQREHPVADLLYRMVVGLRQTSVPTIPVLHRTLYNLRAVTLGILRGAHRIVWCTPLFQSRLMRPAPGLFLYGGIPLVIGTVEIEIGSGCRVSGQTTITGRTAPTALPRLTVGKNVDIGWQTTIAVGRTVTIGDNVRIAGRAFLAGYPGHPLDAKARAQGLPDSDDQIGDIILEDDVWLATGVTVTAGVRIGRGTIVAAGSVVTHDLPPQVLAGGIPARPIRTL
jgi:acetyltransferase-like isoleucine patch superfamily enzyme